MLLPLAHVALIGVVAGALANDANDVWAFPWIMADFIALIAWGSRTLPWIMTSCVALVA